MIIIMPKNNSKINHDGQNLQVDCASNLYVRFIDELMNNLKDIKNKSQNINKY